MDMEIIITFSDNGKFTVNKTDNTPIFTAVGMLELAKQVLLNEPVSETREEIEGQLTIEEVVE